MGGGHAGPALRWRRDLWAVAVAATLLTPVLLAWSSKPAHACSCARTSVAQSFEKATTVVYGQKTGQHVTGTAPDNRRVYDFAVDTVVKGQPGPVIELSTALNGGLCGTVLPGGRFAILAGDPQPDLSYGIYSCGNNVVAVEQIEALLGTTAPTDGRSPPTVLVRADLGDISLIATDTSGRPVRYGRVRDLGPDLAPCPGNAKVLVQLDHPATSGPYIPTMHIGVVDVATLTLESERVVALGDAPPDVGVSADGLVCLSADGSRSAFRVLTVSAHPPYGFSTTGWVEHDGQADARIEGFTPRSLDAGGDRVLGVHGTSIAAVALDSLALTDLFPIPPPIGAVAFSPDGSRVALTQPGIGFLSSEVLVLALADGSEWAHLATSSMRYVRLAWADPERITLDGEIGNGTVTVAVDTAGTDLGQAPGLGWLVGNRFWVPSSDRPGHPATALTVLPDAAPTYALLGANTYDVVHVIPDAIGGTAATSIVATPSFTG